MLTTTSPGSCEREIAQEADDLVVVEIARYLRLQVVQQ